MINNAVFRKTMEEIKKKINYKRRNQLVSKPNCHTKKCFSEKILAIEMKKTKVKIN